MPCFCIVATGSLMNVARRAWSLLRRSSKFLRASPSGIEPPCGISCHLPRPTNAETKCTPKSRIKCQGIPGFNVRKSATIVREVKKNRRKWMVNGKRMAALPGGRAGFPRPTASVWWQKLRYRLPYGRGSETTRSIRSFTVAAQKHRSWLRNNMKNQLRGCVRKPADRYSGCCNFIPAAATSFRLLQLHSGCCNFVLGEEPLGGFPEGAEALVAAEQAFVDPLLTSASGVEHGAAAPGGEAEAVEEDDVDVDVAQGDAFFEQARALVDEGVEAALGDALGREVALGDGHFGGVEGQLSLDVGIGDGLAVGAIDVPAGAGFLAEAALPEQAILERLGVEMTEAELLVDVPDA